MNAPAEAFRCAYKLEYRRLEEMVYGGKRQQLWNVIPHTTGAGPRRSSQRPLLDRPSSQDALEILKRDPAAEFSRPNFNRRRPPQLDQLGVSVPAPTCGGHERGPAQLRSGHRTLSPLPLGASGHQSSSSSAGYLVQSFQRTPIFSASSSVREDLFHFLTCSSISRRSSSRRPIGVSLHPRD
jgi:hypothetical protein